MRQPANRALPIGAYSVSEVLMSYVSSQRGGVDNTYVIKCEIAALRQDRLRQRRQLTLVQVKKSLLYPAEEVMVAIREMRQQKIRYTVTHADLRAKRKRRHAH